MLRLFIVGQLVRAHAGERVKKAEVMVIDVDASIQALTFLYWYDNPAKYTQGEWPELTWFDECPTVWDETRVLDGKIGEYIVIARRRGERWFIGAITNEQGRKLEVSLEIIGPSRPLECNPLYADGEPAKAPHEATVIVSQRTVERNHKIELVLAPAGGRAIRLQRKARPTP